jgi:membrane protein
VVSTRHITGLIGLVGLLWPATAVFGTIRKSVNFLWGVQKTRPFFHERFIDFALTAATGMLMVTPLAITVGIGFLGEVIEAIYPNTSFRGDEIVGRVFGYLSPLVSFSVFMLLYRYLPNTKVTFREVWPGALLASIAFEVTKYWFLWYARTYPLLDTIYGPLGALVALLGWVWISADILLYGAMATSRYSRYVARRAEETGLQILAGVRRLIAAESRQNA